MSFDPKYTNSKKSRSTRSNQPQYIKQSQQSRPGSDVYVQNEVNHHGAGYAPDYANAFGDEAYNNTGHPIFTDLANQFSRRPPPRPPGEPLIIHQPRVTVRTIRSRPSAFRAQMLAQQQLQRQLSNMTNTTISTNATNISEQIEIDTNFESPIEEQPPPPIQPQQTDFYDHPTKKSIH